MAEDDNTPQEPTPTQDPATPEPTGSWRDTLPDELRAEKSLESFKDISGLAKSYVESQRMLGSRVKIPAEDAPKEDWDKFYAKMGRPDGPEGYEIADPGDMPPGMNWDSELADWFSQTAFELGLPKGKAKEFVSRWNERQSQFIHNSQKEMGKELDALKREWGDNFDGNVELGVRAIERAFKTPDDVEKFRELMDTTGVGNHPLMLKLANYLGKMMKNDGYIISDGKGGMLGTEGAKSKIAEVNAAYNNKDSKYYAYWDINHPDHKRIKAEVDGYYRTLASE